MRSYLATAIACACAGKALDLRRMALPSAVSFPPKMPEDRVISSLGTRNRVSDHPGLVDQHELSDMLTQPGARAACVTHQA